MRTRFLGVAGLLVILSAPFGLLAHGGRTDSLGCHHNRKAGGYHCHSGPLAGRSFSSKSQAQAALQELRTKKKPQPASEQRKRRDAETLSASEAKDHIGEQATVCGKVVSARYAASSRGRPTFLNLDRPHPNQIFTVVIWGRNRAQSGKPEKDYLKKEICVTGKIETYRGKPQIEAKASGDILLKGSKIKEN